MNRSIAMMILWNQEQRNVLVQNLERTGAKIQAGDLRSLLGLSRPTHPLVCQTHCGSGRRLRFQLHRPDPRFHSGAGASGRLCADPARRTARPSDHSSRGHGRLPKESARSDRPRQAGELASSDVRIRHLAVPGCVRIPPDEPPFSMIALLNRLAENRHWQHTLTVITTNGNECHGNEDRKVPKTSDRARDNVLAACDSAVRVGAFRVVLFSRVDIRSQPFSCEARLR